MKPTAYTCPIEIIQTPESENNAGFSSCRYGDRSSYLIICPCGGTSIH
jgi:hypothetical protein